MNAPRDEYLDLCAGYVLDALDAEDRTRLEERLRAGDLLCEAALYEMYAGVLLLAATSPAAAPPAELRSRVMDAIDAAGPPERASEDAAFTADADAESAISTSTPGPSEARRDPIAEARAFRERGRSTGAFWGILAAAAAVVVALIGWNVAQSLRNELELAEVRLTQLEGELATAEKELASARETLTQEEDWAHVVGARDVLVISIDPIRDEVAQVFGRCYMDPESGRAVVYFYDVPQMPENSHQLWAIDDSGPHPVGFVHPDGDGYDEVRLALEDLHHVHTLAVSLEPKGGSPKPDGPSGPVMLMGQVGE